MVGIFFKVGEELLVDAVPFEKGEPHGKAIQHGDHYEYWKTLVPSSRAERIFKSKAYDSFPRGRVIFNTAKNKYFLNVDKCLQNKNDITFISMALKVSSPDVQADEDYKCAKCNPDLMD